jgi:2'-5' RNA ligase
MNASTKRLFFALWPQPETSLKLYELAGRFAPGGKRVPPENIHLTLVFIGPAPPALERCAEQVADAIRGASFPLMLEQVGGWARSGILWAGPARSPRALLHLVEALNTGLAGCGYAPETRPYAAHLTLARKIRHPQGMHQIDPLRWDVCQFCLVQSRTDAGGARYEILRTWPLGSLTA